MKRVRLTALAEFDLVEAQDFYAQDGAWVLDHFMNCINEALAQLADFAGIHPIVYGHHRMGIPHFPFSAYYDIEGEDAVVQAVLDDRFGPARIAAHFGPQYGCPAARADSRAKRDSRRPREPRQCSNSERPHP